MLHLDRRQRLVAVDAVACGVALSAAAFESGDGAQVVDAIAVLELAHERLAVVLELHARDGSALALGPRVEVRRCAPALAKVRLRAAKMTVAVALELLLGADQDVGVAAGRRAGRDLPARRLVRAAPVTLDILHRVRPQQ